MCGNRSPSPSHHPPFPFHSVNTITRTKNFLPPQRRSAEPAAWNNPPSPGFLGLRPRAASAPSQGSRRGHLPHKLEQHCFYSSRSVLWKLDSINRPILRGAPSVPLLKYIYHSNYSPNTHLEPNGPLQHLNIPK